MKVPRILLLTSLLLVALLPLEEAAPAATNSDQVARLFKTMQESVFEGEMIKLECNEDYVIDVIVAEHSEQPALKKQLETTAAIEQCNSTTSQPLLGREETRALVRSNCQNHSACKLDLRWGPPANELANEQAKKLRKMVLGLAGNEAAAVGRSNETCASRRLLEIVYRCRANKMKLRTVCRNAKLQLECGADRQIVVISAEYGGWPNETRLNEKCSQSQQSSLIQANNYHPCQANQSATSALVSARCTNKRLCSLDVRPEILGDPKCSPGQPELLRVHYLCASESYLISGAQQNQEQQQLDESLPPVLLASSEPAPTSPQLPSNSLATFAVNWPSLLLPDPKLRKLLPHFLGLCGLTFVIFATVKLGHFWARRGRRRQSEKKTFEKKNKKMKKGRLSTSSSSTKNSLSSASGQAGSDAFLVKYLPNSASATNSASSTSGSTNSSSSSTAQSSLTAQMRQQANTGSANRDGLLMMGGCRIGLQAANSGSKHNSCSESCFSLDDYQLASQQQLGSSATNSPALMINEQESPTGLANQAHHRQQQQHQSFATARPRLWPVYGNSEHYNNNNTMRPTRTFLGQQPTQTLQRCPQHALLPAAPDRLLMALNNPNQIANQISGKQADWVPQASPVERLAALLQQQRRQQQQAQLVQAGEHFGENTNQCAFHQAPVQQLVFPPPAIQLELPQLNQHLNQQPPAGMRQFAPQPPPSAGNFEPAAPMNVIPPSSCDN